MRRTRRSSLRRAAGTRDGRRLPAGVPDGGARHNRGGRAATPLAEANISAIRAADSAFGASANASDVAGIVAVYAPDASLLPPSAPAIKGSDGIRQYWGGFLDAYRLDFQLQSDQVEGRGDLAYVLGRYRLAATPKGKAPPMKDEGKFVEVLKRQADGSWRYGVDIHNSDLPAK